jgi:hypothetical protein
LSPLASPTEPIWISTFWFIVPHRFPINFPLNIIFDRTDDRRNAGLSNNIITMRSWIWGRVTHTQTTSNFQTVREQSIWLMVIHLFAFPNKHMSLCIHAYYYEWIMRSQNVNPIRMTTSLLYGSETDILHSTCPSPVRTEQALWLWSLFIY